MSGADLGVGMGTVERVLHYEYERFALGWLWFLIRRLPLISRGRVEHCDSIVGVFDAKQPFWNASRHHV